MPHLYFHIPFCKQACHYCDFHFSTSQKNRTAIVQAMLKELELRKGELPGKELQSVYFGGGTPSVLSQEELLSVFDAIAKDFSIAENAEVTLEANPDDLTPEYLAMLKRTPVNRLSIGIQSFRESDLRMMNRAHTVEEAEMVVKRAQDAGFTNLTVDLIYGIPGLSLEEWQQHLEKINALDVPHFSAYCLTVEPRTALAHLVKTGKVQPVDEELASQHFYALAEFAAAQGFEHYEISNLAKPGFIAKHNSSYWFGEPYLGIGPSAHSFDGTTRRWNVANNAQYLRAIAAGEKTFEEEQLNPKERFNEWVMTRLRTLWGLSPEEVMRQFGEEVFRELEKSARPWLLSGHLILANGALVLTVKGRLMADRIASDLFLA